MTQDLIQGICMSATTSIHVRVMESAGEAVLQVRDEGAVPATGHNSIAQALEVVRAGGASTPL